MITPLIVAPAFALLMALAMRINLAERRRTRQLLIFDAAAPPAASDAGHSIPADQHADAPPVLVDIA